MNKFNSDFYANLNKETKIKNELSMKETTIPQHQQGTDKNLTQINYDEHNKIYNWRNCQCRLKKLNILNDNFIHG